MTELRLLKIVTAVALATAIGCGVTLLILWYRGNNQQAQLQAQVDRITLLAHQNHRVLCLSKADDRRNLAASRAFLKEHPDGTADFSRDFILMSIHQSQMKLANLSDVHCTSAQLRH